MFRTHSSRATFTITTLKILYELLHVLCIFIETTITRCIHVTTAAVIVIIIAFEL
jgi:hypothetical protein